ncbi:hypothetical protein F183_A05010 [Bryobacterales bacterium F-183]|nr:hypothetical protein F183_A05010 [Bryobacterales bacterium F-183]
MSPLVLGLFTLLVGDAAGSSCNGNPELQGLAYPKDARAARFSGTVRATFRVDSMGKAAEVQYPIGHPMLVAGVERAIAATTFDRACFNQTLQVEVVFHMDSTPDVVVPPDRVERGEDGRYHVYTVVSSRSGSEEPRVTRQSTSTGAFRYLRLPANAVFYQTNPNRICLGVPGTVPLPVTGTVTGTLCA